MSAKYISLHGHTTYSEMDSNARIDKLVKKAKDYGMDAIAITEHGNMYSMVKNYTACNETNPNDPNDKPIELIIGEEFYHTINYADNDDNRFHLVGLAKTQEGLINLYRMSTEAGLHKLHGKTKDYPRADVNTFKKYGKGIIALSACIGGLIPQLILGGQYDLAKQWAVFFSKIFDEFYLEVQPHTIPEQLIVNAELVRMSQETGIGLVITNDHHYVEKSDKNYHNILLAMGYRKPFTVDADFKSPDEMEQYCIDNNIPLTAMSNTVDIASRCKVDPRVKDARGLMPAFDCPPGYSESTYLYKLSFDGLMEMHKTKHFPDLMDRINQLNYELDIICSMGFAGYFLILWDWFSWCRDNKILMGKGRGSAAGSMVSYALKITTIDPIKNGYFFERFLNPERIEFPDVDSDISKADRAKGIGYLLQKYGADYVSQIITFTKYKLKNLIKDSMRAFNLPFEEANEITKKLPDMIDGKEASLERITKIATNSDAYIGDLGARTVNEIVRAHDMLIDLFKRYPDVYDAVNNLSGCISGTGIHAGGVIISGKKLADNIPLITGSDTAVLPLVQFPMEDLDFFKALKIDVLGLNTLTQTRIAMDLIGLDDEWFDSEDFSDPDVYKLMRDGFTTDIFQMGSYNATKMIRDMKVDSIEGLTDVNAGNRPGPLSKDKVTNKSLVDVYIENTNRGKIDKIHPLIDPILASTQGCIWYQEQCMALGQVMAGYSLGAADIRIRKVLGKKKVEKIPEIETEFIYGKKPEYRYDDEGKPILDKDGHKVILFRDIHGNEVDGYEQGGRPVPSEENSSFCKGALANGFDLKLAQKIFDQMKEFAKYSFNKAHSGAYAALAYKTAWLLLYHPVEWCVACLLTHDKTEKIVATLSQAKSLGIKILPPDINKSEDGFTIETLPDGTKAIRFGLVAIKGVGPRAVSLIKQLRPFVDFNDYYTKVHSVARETNPETGKLMNNPLDSRSEVPLINSGAFDCFEENRYKVLNMYHAIRKDKVDKEDPSKFTRKIKLNMERDIMGAYISEHPLDHLPYVDLDNVSNGEEVEIAGIIKTVTVKKSKRGTNFANVIFEAKDGKDKKAVLFDAYEKYKSRLNKGEIVIICGSYNTKWQNINCEKVKKLVRKKAEPQEVAATSQAPVRDDSAFDSYGSNIDELFGGM